MLWARQMTQRMVVLGDWRSKVGKWQRCLEGHRALDPRERGKGCRKPGRGCSRPPACSWKTIQNQGAQKPTRFQCDKMVGKRLVGRLINSCKVYKTLICLSMRQFPGWSCRCCRGLWSTEAEAGAAFGPTRPAGVTRAARVARARQTSTFDWLGFR